MGYGLALAHFLLRVTVWETIEAEIGLNLSLPVIE